MVKPVKATAAAAPGVITFSGSLTDTGEDGETTVSLSNVGNQFLDKHGFTDTSTTEQTNLTTSGVRSQQVDDLDTGFQDLSGSGALNESWRLGVNWVSLLRFDRASFIDRFTDNVDDSTQSASTNRDGDRSTSVGDSGTSNQTFSTIHSNGSDGVFTQMLGDFQNQVLVTVLQGQGVENSRQVTIVEVDVNNGTNDGSVNVSIRDRDKIMWRVLRIRKVRSSAGISLDEIEHLDETGLVKPKRRGKTANAIGWDVAERAEISIGRRGGQSANSTG